MTLEDLVEEVRSAVEGRPLTGRWRRDHMPVRRNWMGGVSNNLPRLAEAALAAERPQEAAEWWADLLDEEWSVGGRWDAEEQFSRTYFGHTWAAEAAAHVILARQLPGHRAIRFLERSLVRRAAAAALCAVPDVVASGARNQVVYRGVGIAWTGGRSNHHINHPADHVAHRALTGRPPSIENHVDALTELCDAILTATAPHPAVHPFGVPPALRARLWSTVAERVIDPPLRDASAPQPFSVTQLVADLIGPARVAAPSWVRGYRQALACSISWNPSSNTSCTFLVVVRMARQGEPVELASATFLHPYGPHGRVRGGTQLGKKILGRGETWWEQEGRLFACANLTAAEATAKGGPRWELRELMPPQESLEWEVRFSPEHQPGLIRNGTPSAPPGPVSPPPSPPAPAPPKPPPPPEPRPATGVRRHVVPSLNAETRQPEELIFESSGPGQPLIFIRGGARHA